MKAFNTVRYHRAVRRARALALLLAALVAAGPVLLDRCLISCHDELSSESAVPSCHEHVAEGNAPSVHGVSACGHDHEALPADTVIDGRVAGQRHVSPVAVASAVYELHLPVPLSLAVAPHRAVPYAPFGPVLVQLRV